MPAVIVAIVLAVLVYTGYMTIFTAIVIAVSLAYGDYKRRSMNRKARDAWNASLRDRNVTLKSTELPKTLAYGECTVGGGLWYAASFGSLREFLYIGILLGPGHEIESIDSLYLNDELVPLKPNGESDVGSRYSAYSYPTPSKVVNAAPGLVTVTTDGHDINYGPGALANIRAWYQPSGEGEQPVYFTPFNYTGTTFDVEVGGFGYQGQFQVTFDSRVLNSYVKMEKHRGNVDDVASPMLVAETGGEVQSTDVGRNCPYVALRFYFSEDVFPNSVPPVKIRFKGKRVYDPRKDSTNGGSGAHRRGIESTWEYSTNNALCTRDYLTHPLGYGCPDEEIDDDLIRVAANICDELIPAQQVWNGTAWTPGIVKRYTCNGVVDPSADPGDNLDMLAASMAGIVTFSQGKWRVYAGAYRTPTLTLYSKNVTNRSEFVVQAKPEPSALFNSVKGQFIDPLQNFQPVDYPAVIGAQYVEDDGGERIFFDMPLPLTNDGIMAQRLALITLEQSRQSLTVRGSFDMTAYSLWPGETVILHMPDEFGFVNKVFRVIEREFALLNFGPLLTLREEAAAVYTVTSPAGYDLADNTSFPDPRDVAALTGLSVTSGNSTVQVNRDGTVIPRFLVSWNKSTDAFVLSGGRIDLEYLSTDNASLWTPVGPLQGDATETYVAGLRVGRGYRFRVRGVNGVGVRGAWLYDPQFRVLQGKTTAPSTVGPVSWSIEPFGVRLRWPLVADFDVKSYEVRLDGSSWENATSVVILDGNDFLWRIRESGTYTIRVRARDTSGNFSSADSTATVVIPQNSATGVFYVIVDENLVLSWAGSNAQFVIREYVVEYQTGPSTWVEWQRVKGLSSQRQVVWGGARTFRVAPVDEAGNIGVYSQIAVPVSSPIAPAVNVQVLTNTVIITGSDPTTTLPVKSIELKSGPVGVDWNSAIPRGFLGSGRFTSFDEVVGGTYDYLLEATDSAGNKSAVGRATATVLDPPAFRRFANIDSTFGGSKTNVLLESVGLTLLAPFNTGETVAQHYATRGWTTPAQKIAAGFPYVAHPTSATGVYQEDVDHGTTIVAAKIDTTLTTAALVGAVGVAIQVGYKLNLGDPWTLGPSNQASLFATNFRYTRRTVTFTSQASGLLNQHGVLRVSKLNIALSTERKSDTGSANANSADVGGTRVLFIRQDFDVPPVVKATAVSTVERVAVIDPGSVDRFGFDVYLFENGTRVSGTINWQADQGV